jgi:hypothetical protein
LGLRAKSTNFVISTGFSKDFGRGKSKYSKALIIDIQERSGVAVSGVYEMKNERHMPNFRLPREKALNAINHPVPKGWRL